MAQGTVAPKVLCHLVCPSSPAARHPPCNTQWAMGTPLMGCHHRAMGTSLVGCSHRAARNAQWGCLHQAVVSHARFPSAPEERTPPSPGLRIHPWCLPGSCAPWTPAPAAARSLRDNFSRSRGGLWGESRRPARCGVGGVRAEISPPHTPPLGFLLQRSCSQKAGWRLAGCPPASRISGCSLKLADSYLTQTAKLLSFPLGPPSLSLLKCQITAYI